MAIKMPSSEPDSQHPAQLSITKLRQASEQIDEVENLWQDYMRRETWQFEIAKDEMQHALVLVVRLSSPLPTEALNGLLRSSVNSGRSALDNLITSLARDNVTTEKELRLLAFPITQSGEEWKKGRWDSKLRSLTDEGLARVKRVQPFCSISEPGLGHPLQILHELWNADKHRNSFSAAIGLSPRAAQVELLEMQFDTAVEHLEDVKEHLSDIDATMDLNLGPIGNGTHLITIRVPKDVNLDQVDIRPRDATFTLGLIGPGVSITHSGIAVLRNALRYARETVRFVSGISDQLPHQYPPGFVVIAPEP